MTSDSDKRQTHVDFSRVKRDLQSLPPIPEPRELYTKAQNAFQDGPQSPEQLPQGSKRKRTGSPGGAIVETRARSEELILPKAADAGVRPHEYVPIKNKSPWQSLQKVYELKLDGFITVAIRKPPSCEIVTVKNFVGSDRDQKVKRLQQTQHENFVRFLEAFHSEGSVYVVLDYVPISLAHVVASPAYPTELQLAAILGQILDGLAYLAFKKLEHGALTCSNVLVTREGVIKIASQECCRDVGSLPGADLADAKALGHMAMELMQKYTQDDGAIGVEDCDRWPSDSKAVHFLAMTTSTTSIRTLREHPLIKSPWRKEDLKWMVALAGVSAYRGYKYL